MKIVFFYLDSLSEMCEIVQDYCEERDFECDMFNVDEDPDVLDDYNVKGIPPIFIVFDDLGHRVLTHKGRFDKSKFNQIVSTLD